MTRSPEKGKGKKSHDILSGSDSDGDGDVSKIQINAAYARRLEHNKRREALHRYEELKKQGRVALDSNDDDDDEESPSSGDEAADAAASRRDEVRFLIALVRIRSNDPSVLDKDAKIYSSSEDDADEVPREAERRKAKKERPLYLKDVNARDLLEEGPEFAETSVKFEKKAYNEHQRELLREFQAADKAAFDEDDDDDVIREKAKGGGSEEEEGEEGQQAKELLNEIFNDETDENEKFLKDFFLNQRYRNRETEKKTNFDEIGVLSEDEDELDKQDEYEAKYNFRHEEAAALGLEAERVMGHSRVVEGSVRKKENSRKQQRKSKEERIVQAKQELAEEVKQLKNLKRKEINEKLEKIRMIAGIEEGAAGNLGVNDLEEDFDPEEHEKKMKEMFGDDYYDAEDVDPGFGSGAEIDLNKPDFDEEDELLGLPKNWALGESREGFAAENEGNLQKEEEKELPNEEDEGEKKQKNKISLKDKVELEKELEEYYKLDFEDNIGDLKTRFKYKKVKPNSFGLSTLEILMEDDTELNQYVPLKKLAPYREKEWKVTRHKKMSKDLILGGEKKNGKVKTSKKSKSHEGPSSSEPEKEKQTNEVEETNGKTKSTRSTRRKRRRAELKLSDPRRMAYGMVPSKRQKK